MAWTTPLTWAISQIVSAANLNTHLRDNLNETAPGKAANEGDTFYATAANAIVVLPAGDPGTTLVMNAAGTVPIWGAAQHVCGGRLTLETGVPVSTADQAAKTTVYFTPYLGDRIALRVSGDWIQTEFAEVSVAVPSTTVTPFDIFGYYSGGALAIETLDWTDDANRATGLTLVNGVLTKTGNATRRYLGTGRTTDQSGECEDSEAVRFLWNYYNRLLRAGYRTETTQHTYGTNTSRAWRGDSDNKVDFVLGVLEEKIILHISAQMDSSVDGDQGYVDVYFDGGEIGSGRVRQANIKKVEASNTLTHLPAIGYHYYTIFQKAPGGTTVTFDTAELDVLIRG